jgi:membrane fusion protein, multidrug efflux system
VKDAQLDLEYCHVTAPFTGKISNHLVSIGNLISGSRYGTSPTTLLTTLVSLDPIYLDFDMSQNEFLEYQRARRDSAAANSDVVLELDGAEQGERQGTVDFIDNSINRGSGTIHARATVKNDELSLVPGEFNDLTVMTGAPRSVLLIPDASVSLDQSEHMVMTVSPDGTVVPKNVALGELWRGLRVVRSGLSGTDRVIIDGVQYATPGGKVTAEPASLNAAPNGNQD